MHRRSPDRPSRGTRHKQPGKVISAKETARLVERGRQPRSLVEFFARSPLAGSGINLERTRDCGRPVEL